MCSPTFAIFAIQAVQTLASANAQQKAANKQADLMTQQENAAQNAQSLQMNQVASQAAEQMNERAKAARAEAATFDAVAGEYGGGVTADRGAATIANSANHDLGTIATNRDSNLAQIGQDAKASGLKYQAGIASIPRPSKLGVALTIGGQAAGAYASTQKPNPKP
jgi:predicted Zn-dependent protease